jgi:hypothetical protein
MRELQSQLNQNAGTARTAFRSRKATRVLAATAAGLVTIFFAAGCNPPAPLALPADAQDACPLSQSTFNGWFQASGGPTLNGVVNPANSTMNLQPNCGFYAWSEQMFLWLTSPAPASYGGGAHIFDSPAFYDVTPPDATGSRTLLAHSPGLLHAFPLRTAQLGPHGLQVVVDVTGRSIEVKPAEANAPLLVRNPAGQVVQAVHARLEAGRVVLLDSKQQVIPVQHLATLTNANDLTEATRKGNAVFAQKFVIDRIPIFLDPTLAVIDVEQGQAGDNSVLEAQTAANGSLIYYATMVNDVYAYFLTGVKKGVITTTPSNQFPTTPSDLSNTLAFAAANGKPAASFPDANALAVEVKSSWVVAAGLPNLNQYVTMNATIPVYDKSNPNLWTQTGQQTVQLALVGMHVVGSTAGHAEMVWATFEHTGNAPVGTYTYNSTSGSKTVASSSAGTWLFSTTNSTATPNVPHMTATGAPTNTINSASNPAGGTFTISASDTLRIEPWGIDGTNASSNTEVISMNEHVTGMLTAGDIRGNYLMTGATWTPGGSDPSPTNQGVGTSKLSNSTMETYAQGGNCFSCHQNDTAGLTNPTTEISHIFGPIKPLF